MSVFQCVFYTKRYKYKFPFSLNTFGLSSVVYINLLCVKQKLGANLLVPENIIILYLKPSVYKEDIGANLLVIITCLKPSVCKAELSADPLVIMLVLKLSVFKEELGVNPLVLSLLCVKQNSALILW
jgi:hypothetical protein